MATNPNAAGASKGDSKPDAGKSELNISVEEFLRTRDSVVTGLTTLIGAINELIRAYLAHTNQLLNGKSQGDGGLDTYAISNFLSTATNAAALAADGGRKRKRQKKERDPNAPKRPLTAFFLYSSSARPVVKADLGDSASPVEVNNEILRRWKAMDDIEKKKWKDQYEINNEQYRADVAAYKARTGRDLLDGEHEIADEDDAVAAAVVAAAAVAANSDDDSSEDDKPPPPVVKKPAKSKSKKKEAEKPASPSPSAQLVHKETPVPLPGAAGKSTPAKRKKADDGAADDHKKKKPRKSKGADEDKAEPEAAAGKKDKKKKKGKD